MQKPHTLERRALYDKGTLPDNPDISDLGFLKLRLGAKVV
jgi:hypothetical protein